MSELTVVRYLIQACLNCRIVLSLPVRCSETISEVLADQESGTLRSMSQPLTACFWLDILLAYVHGHPDQAPVPAA
jgi:hypothetical protein